MEQLAVHFKFLEPCIYRKNVATLVATLNTCVLLTLGSQWQGEQISFFGWGPFVHVFWVVLSKRGVWRKFRRDRREFGNSDFRAASAMKDSSSYKIEETSTMRILFKECSDYRE